MELDQAAFKRVFFATCESTDDSLDSVSISFCVPGRITCCTTCLRDSPAPPIDVSLQSSPLKSDSDVAVAAAAAAAVAVAVAVVVVAAAAAAAVFQRHTVGDFHGRLSTTLENLGIVSKNVPHCHCCLFACILCKKTRRQQTCE